MLLLLLLVSLPSDRPRGWFLSPIIQPAILSPPPYLSSLPSFRGARNDQEKRAHKKRCTGRGDVRPLRNASTNRLMMIIDFPQHS